MVQEDEFAELYDPGTDPYETRNLAGASENRGKLESLWAGLRDAMSETGDFDPRLSRILSGPPGR